MPMIEYSSYGPASAVATVAAELQAHGVVVPDPPSPCGCGGTECADHLLVFYVGVDDAIENRGLGRMHTSILTARMAAYLGRHGVEISRPARML